MEYMETDRAEPHTCWRLSPSQTDEREGGMGRGGREEGGVGQEEREGGG